jgi:hypothetical protein
MGIYYYNYTTWTVGDCRLCSRVVQGSLTNKDRLQGFYYDRQIVFCEICKFKNNLSPRAPGKAMLQPRNSTLKNGYYGTAYTVSRKLYLFVTVQI